MLHRLPCAGCAASKKTASQKSRLPDTRRFSTSRCSYIHLRFWPSALHGPECNFIHGNKIPMAKRSAVCSYTADGRAIIHSNLQLNPFVLKGLREDTSNRHSTEYHDCKLSLFSAQKGKCAISGDEFTNATDIVAWLKTPKYMGGFERYKNMTLIHKKYLILLEKLPQAELKAYLKSLNVTKKMLGKINSLRERAGLLAII